MFYKKKIVLLQKRNKYKGGAVEEKLAPSDHYSSLKYLSTSHFSRKFAVLCVSHVIHVTYINGQKLYNFKDIFIIFYLSIQILHL